MPSSECQFATFSPSSLDGYQNQDLLQSLIGKQFEVLEVTEFYNLASVRLEKLQVWVKLEDLTFQNQDK